MTEKYPADTTYYEVLELEESTSVDDVLGAVKAQTRIWRRRAESPALEVRQEAEKRLALISEAGEVLGDSSKRSVYDTWLRDQRSKPKPQPAPQPQPQPTPQPTPPPQPRIDWAKDASDALALGRYQEAQYAARHAVETDDSAESWYLLGQASMGMGRYPDAEIELNRSLSRDASRADTWISLGQVRTELHNIRGAIDAYQQAAHRTNDPYVHYGLAQALARGGQQQPALQVLTTMRQQNPANPNVGDYYGHGVLEVAETIPRARGNNDTYWITSKEELTQMKELVQRVKTDVPNPDPGLAAEVQRVEAYLTKVQRRSFQGGWVRRSGCLGLIAAFFLVIMPLSAFSSAVSRPGLTSIPYFLFGLGLLYLDFRIFWKPQWKINQQNLS